MFVGMPKLEPFSLACLGLALLSFSLGILAALIASRRLQARALQFGLNAIPLAIMVHDSNGKIRIINPSARQLLKIENRSIKGLRLNEVLSERSPDNCCSINDVLAKARAGAAQSADWGINHRLGQVRLLGWRLQAMPWRGRWVIVSVLTDMDWRRELERDRGRLQAQLLRFQRMESMGRLFSGFAFNFNNAITGIMGSLSLLKMMVDEGQAGSSEKVGEYVIQGLRSCEEASQLSRQLLDFSEDRSEPSTVFDVRETMEKLVHLCRHSYPRTVEIEYQKPLGGFMVQGNRSSLEQAILNVCINGMQALITRHTLEEGFQARLSVKISHIEPDGFMPSIHPTLEPNHRYCRVEISDNGQGMSPEVQKRAFEPFYHGEGAGLGLYVAYCVMQNHHGSLSIESKPGLGTKVFLDIPAYQD